MSKYFKVVALSDDEIYDDSRGYNIGPYLYHVTPTTNIKNIKKNGFELNTGGTTFLKNTYKPRVYFATSLIAAYDLSVNFSSDRGIEHSIIKLKSDFLKDYQKDSLFKHGIFIDYPVDKKYIVEIFDANDLFNKYDEEDIENLYLGE